MNIPHLSPHNTALFTDFDGTLVPIAETPGGIVIPEQLVTLAETLNTQLSGAFAVITGRSLRDLGSLFDIDSITAAGAHGAEWQIPQQQLRQDIGSADELFADIRPNIQRFAQEHNLLLEDKRFALALHFRTAPHLEAELDDFLLTIIGKSASIKMVRGKCVREIKPEGINKGVAIERFMQMPPFAGRTPVFLGDDTTDEDGFRWINANGGVSIKIGEGGTEALYRLPDCAATLDFLQRLCIAD